MLLVIENAPQHSIVEDVCPVSAESTGTVVGS